MFHRFAPRQGAPTAAESVMTKTSGLYSIAADGMKGSARDWRGHGATRRLVRRGNGVGHGRCLAGRPPVATQDLSLWFERITDERIRQAAREAGGFWISGFGMQPPAFGGAGLERIDVVLTAHGLDAFPIEYDRAVTHDADGVTLRVLPLDRIMASKRATKRAKDLAQLPALEATLLARKQRDNSRDE
jgi:hypothetical protein